MAVGTIGAINRTSFGKSTSGRMYYAYSGRGLGIGAASALAVVLFEGTSPNRDLFVKLFFSMDWHALAGQEYGGLIVTLNDGAIIDFTTSGVDPGGLGGQVVYHEFLLPRASTLKVEGVSDDTDNERYSVMLGYPV